MPSTVNVIKSVLYLCSSAAWLMDHTGLRHIFK